MKISAQQFLNEYIPNPDSARNFNNYKVLETQRGLFCTDSKTSEFLSEFIVDGVFRILQPVTVNKDNVILNGNIRYHFVNQVSRHMTVADIEIEVREFDRLHYQLRNDGSPLTLRQKMLIVSKLENDTGLNNLYRYYKKVLKDYNALPEWLKLDGDIYDVNPKNLIAFNNSYGEPKDWERVKKYALKDAVTKLSINPKHIKMLEDSKGISSVFDDDDHDLNDAGVDDLDLKIVQTLEKLKNFLSENNVEQWYNGYQQVCSDKKKFLIEMDKLLYILESGIR